MGKGGSTWERDRALTEWDKNLYLVSLGEEAADRQHSSGEGGLFL